MSYYNSAESAKPDADEASGSKRSTASAREAHAVSAESASSRECGGAAE